MSARTPDGRRIAGGGPMPPIDQREFSRRVNVEVFKDEPMSPDEWCEMNSHETDCEDGGAEAYAGYLGEFQPYRWHAKAANGEIIARGESYFNEADCINAIELNYGDDTSVYYAPMYGDDRGFRWLRYGATDRAAQAAQ